MAKWRKYFIPTEKFRKCNFSNEQTSKYEKLTLKTKKADKSVFETKKMAKWRHFFSSHLHRLTFENKNCSIPKITKKKTNRKKNKMAKWQKYQKIG